MKIAVLGAGAMGCLFGGLLAVGKNEVWLLDVWEEHVKAINEKGLLIEGIKGEKNITNIKATTDAKEVGEADLVIVFVKSTHTEEAIKNSISLIGEKTVVITLQNGLGNVEKLQKMVGEKRVIAGVTSQGSTLIGPAHIRHAGEGETLIGEIDGRITERLKTIEELFNKAGIKCCIKDDIMSLMWSKLIINVGINAITAIIGVKNGEIVNHPASEEILKMAVYEAVEVAKAKGIKIVYADPVEKVKEVCKLTKENISSMLQDIIKKRKTEIDVINGAVVREGEILGIPTPVNKVLTNLVLTIEETYDKRVLL
ncbi:ketopantoate reductase family protein [Thermovenabulum sp.]|uniref:ketopantoate reductase family protein n=1 Tax=Thermovenabulum sp. TaxID=3100335 RepID=UPI003C7DD3A4